MLYVLFSAGILVLILLTISSMALWLLWKSQLRLWNLAESMMTEIRRQNNLLASKDLTTFSTLQTLNSSQVTPNLTEFMPLDDQSVAKQLAKQFIDAGLDPSSAYDNPDDALGELGLKEHGF